MGILLNICGSPIRSNLTSVQIFNEICTLKCLFRRFSINYICFEKNYLSRQGKMMNQLIGTSKKKRKLYFEDSQPVNIAKGPKLGYHGGKENNRRVAVLNSVFMKYISDLMVTGSMAVDVLDKNLEISRVAMAPTFNQLNVFWSTNSEENAAALEAVLPKVGFSIRHELSQLKVMGVVPRISFVRDKYLQNASKVDYLLSIADYGEDHVPLHQGSGFNNRLPVEDTVNLGNNEDSNKEGGSTELPNGPVETMPVMRHDIFNLDHELILNKIMKSLKKSRAAHRFQPNLALECEGLDSSEILQSKSEDNLTKEERRTAMAKFILTRKILIEKRSQNKYQSELNVLPNAADELEDGDVNEDLRTEDYIEEEEYIEENEELKQ